MTGTLRTWDGMDRLAEIEVATLLVGGRHAECRPAHLEEMHRRIAGSRLAIIEDASHLCFTGQPQVFTELVPACLGESWQPQTAIAGPRPAVGRSGLSHQVCNDR